MYTSTELAESVYDILVRPRNNDFVDVPLAIAYAHASNGRITAIGAHEDVYDLLQSLVIPKDSVGLSLVTTGWAAPLNEEGEVDGQPSKHPQKRRVRLIASITREDRGSIIEFADTLEKLADPGDASGSLADALERAWDQNPVLSW